MAPQSQLFGETLAHGSDPKQMALTYDDGPNDPDTPRLLDVLARHEVKATFFLIGRFVKEKPQIARRIAEAGHDIGNHTYTHPWLLAAPLERVRRELRDCEQALDDAVGEHSNFFRPPHGARRPAVLKAVREEGLLPVMWSVTCFDWNPVSADHVELKAVRGIGKRPGVGNIVLLHDGGHLAMGTDRAHTVEASDRLIRRYKSDGYQFVNIDQMAFSHGRRVTS